MSSKIKYIILIVYTSWIVSLKAIADYFDFKVPHNTGFFSLTNSFNDIWHLTENLLLLSVFAPLLFLLNPSRKIMTIYIIIVGITMYVLHEFILHGTILQ